MWPDRRILDLFGIELPILQAPMAGAVLADMAVAVAEAGGLGALPCALLDADGLSIHLNPLQEAVQPEGEPRFGEVLEGIAAAVARIAPRPVVVKEVGFGLDFADVSALRDAGVAAVDVAGAGAPLRHPGELEEGELGAGAAVLVGVEEVVDGRVVLVDRFLHQPQTQHPRVEVDVVLSVGGDRGDVVDPLQLHRYHV